MAIQDSDLFVVGRNKDVKSATGKDVKNFIDTEFINQAGDSMTGELNVQYPTESDHASSKEYVDAEIFKIQNQLDEVGSNLRNGTFELKNPGVFIPPSAGEFSLVNASDETTDTVADTVIIAISHENREGETQMFDDVEKGYIQLKVAGSSDDAVFTIDSIEPSDPSDPSYSQLRVTYHAGNAPTIAGDSICYVNTLHIEGIDLNELQQEFDDRYVKLIGNSDVVGRIRTGTNSGMQITLGTTGKISCKNLDVNETAKAEFFEGDGSKLTGIPRGATISETPPDENDHEIGDFWLKDSTNELHVLKEVFIPGYDHPVFTIEHINNPFQVFSYETQELLDHMQLIQDHYGNTGWGQLFLGGGEVRIQLTHNTQKHTVNYFAWPIVEQGVNMIGCQLVNSIEYNSNFWLKGQYRILADEVFPPDTIGKEWVLVNANGKAILSDSEPLIVDHIPGQFWLNTINYELYVLAVLPDGSIEWIDTCCDDYMPLDISILQDLGAPGNPPYYREFMPTDISILPGLLDPSTP